MAPTADSRETWQSSMIHITAEGRCFVLGCNQFVSKNMYPEEFQEELKNQPGIMSRGKTIAGPFLIKKEFYIAYFKQYKNNFFTYICASK